MIGLGTWEIEGVAAADGPRGGRRGGAVLDSPRIASQSDTPYLDALRDFAERDAGAAPRARPQGRRGRRPAPARGGRRARAGARHPGADVGHRRRRGADAVRRVAAARRRGLGRAAHVVPRQRGLAGQPRRAAHARARAATASCCSATRTRAPSTRWCCRACARRSRRPSSTPTCTSRTACARRRSTRALAETPGAVGAAVVSPTYFGAVADVAALAEVAHGHGVPLIVDEAWGAHLAFSDELPDARPVARARTWSSRAPTRSSAASPSRRWCTSGTAT